MKPLVLTEPGKFKIQDVQDPKPGPFEVLCRIRAAAILKLSGAIWRAPGRRIIHSSQAMNGPVKWSVWAKGYWSSRSAIVSPEKPIKVAVNVATAYLVITIFAKTTVDLRPAIDIMVLLPRALMPSTMSIRSTALTKCRIMFRFVRGPWWIRPV